MRRVKYYSVAYEDALLSGTLESAYRTSDGRFILSEKEIRDIVMRADGREIDAVEITEQEAKRLIAENRYEMGPVPAETAEIVSEEDTETETEDSDDETENT